MSCLTFDGPKPKKKKLTLNVKRNAAGISISKGGCGQTLTVDNN
jgi:hypothetical protein